MNRLMKSSLGAIALVSVLGILTSGCAWSVGGSKGTTVAKPTQGQELIDLKRAHEEGAISDSEYESMRAKILE